MPVKKIAVLGGGMGSLTTVFQLTSDPEWQTKYDITVYQMGWRLGGKGASGRNINVGDRIEEHGLHLWFGFYDNAFNLMQQVYKANNRPSGMPLATWQEAFTGYDFICLEEQVNGQWQHWPTKTEPNDLVPGTSTPPPSVEGYVIRLIDWLCQRHETFTVEAPPEVKSKMQKHAHSTEFAWLKQKYDTLILDLKDDLKGGGELLIHAASHAAKAGHYGLVKDILRDFTAWLNKVGVDIQNWGNTFRHYYILADLTVVSILGMIEDGVIEKGFDVINNYDYRQWLKLHGASQLTIDSAIVQGVYGLVFGGKGQYTFEAGTAIRGLLRMFFTYKGHIYYRMMAGMGDAIFAPMYEVLVKRGVKFQFFNKVTNLGLDKEGKTIDTISIDVQATLAKGYSSYDPLVKVKDLPCWPNFPNVKQLEQGNEILKGNIDLESYYSTWKPVERQALQKGKDFDMVLLGISIGAFPTIAKELLHKSKTWQDMVKYVVPVSTIAYQLWLSSSIQEMEWPYIKDGLSLLGTYQEPYDTWSDMSDLIGRENWPSADMPENIAYFCGPTPQPNANEILKNAMESNFGDPSFPVKQTDLAKKFAYSYLQKLVAPLWPGICQNGFDFSKLVGDFNDQFFRANIDPTELYVMSFTGSSAYRLKADQTALFGNLYITGDWIDNGFNAGCIEATAMAGLQAARAISGVHIEIPGEKDL